jgi:hypothetical protein
LNLKEMNKMAEIKPYDDDLRRRCDLVCKRIAKQYLEERNLTVQTEPTKYGIDLIATR